MLTGTGVVLTGLLASLALVLVLAVGRARARDEVAAATAELRQAEQEARRHASLLTAIMNTITDGVGVVDEHGEFLLHNPAAKQMIGVDQDVGGPDAWQAHYGIFRPDGVTPFPTHELPLVRALRGEASDGVELLIRNPSRPEGVLISVSGRPLDPAAGQPGAVAVFHDITELRARETELRSFAGVVAHDLRTPLTAVGGYAELAADALAEGSTRQAQQAIDRVKAGVARMQRLIDELLTYTAAQDAPLNLTDLDLRTLVDEVVATHRDRPGRQADPPPEISVDPLPPVHADPVLLRQVIDNLIGNAIKYTPPGQPARVEVTAHPEQPGWIQVQVADHGIGIPDGQHAAIFTSFHRAHAGYPGSGLGLAICQRVIERHGGRITATDNPGGGARFLFTLPAAHRQLVAAVPHRSTQPGGRRT